VSLRNFDHRAIWRWVQLGLGGLGHAPVPTAYRSALFEAARAAIPSSPPKSYPIRFPVVPRHGSWCLLHGNCWATALQATDACFGTRTRHQGRQTEATALATHISSLRHNPGTVIRTASIEATSKRAFPWPVLLKGRPRPIIRLLLRRRAGPKHHFTTFLGLICRE
jgi:hypothetical protein